MTLIQTAMGNQNTFERFFPNKREEIAICESTASRYSQVYILYPQPKKQKQKKANYRSLLGHLVVKVFFAKVKHSLM